MMRYVGRMGVCSQGRIGIIEGRKTLPWGESWIGTGLDGEEWASREPRLLSPEQQQALELGGDANCARLRALEAAVRQWVRSEKAMEHHNKRPYDYTRQRDYLAAVENHAYSKDALMAALKGEDTMPEKCPFCGAKPPKTLCRVEMKLQAERRKGNE